MKTCFLKTYLRSRARVITLSVVSAAVFLLTFYLYELPLGAVLYPLAVCAVFAVIFAAFDLRRARLRHNELTRLCRMPGALIERMPEPRSLDDLDYQAIIASLQQEQKQLATDTSLRYSDMVDYYTIWAHQIKTPIAAMRLILQNEDTPAGRQLSDELQRIEQYVEMVLAFMRLDSGSSDYLFREQELDPIVREAVKKFSGQFIRKKLRLYYEPLHARVLTDEKWLAFVIEQVLSNAVKYTNSGGVTIELEAPLTLCIRDTGIGIAPEDLPRVFEKSYTGYNGRSDKKASGIGLYLCRRVCTNLGHRIELSSSLELGTAVRIHLERDELEVE